MGSELRLFNLSSMGKRTSPIVDTDVPTDTSSKSVVADGMQGHGYVNLLRSVKDHGQNQIDLISDDITKLEVKLAELQRERLFTQYIVNVIHDFYSGKETP